MTRSDLSARVPARSSLSKPDVASALGALTPTIADALAEGETVTVAVPAARVPSFKAAKALCARPTHRETDPVSSHLAPIAAAPTPHGSVFVAATHRHASVGTLKPPGCLHPTPFRAAAPPSWTSPDHFSALALRQRIRLLTRDRVAFGAETIRGDWLPIKPSHSLNKNPEAERLEGAVPDRAQITSLELRYEDALLARQNLSYVAATCFEFQRTNSLVDAYSPLPIESPVN